MTFWWLECQGSTSIPNSWQTLLASETPLGLALYPCWPPSSRKDLPGPEALPFVQEKGELPEPAEVREALKLPGSGFTATGSAMAMAFHRKPRLLSLDPSPGSAPSLSAEI